MKKQLGHYEIESELGRGGMGVVYKAFEPALNRHVAIKELSPALAHDPQLVERFLREARSMAALSDPHIIQIFFIGTDETSQQPFFAMEYVDGESLSTVLKRESKLEVENALKILYQAAQGLAAAHDRGVIHRDIKPGNLMLTERGQVKIADFGIALATTDISKKLTSTGEFVGTPGYLSPEVCLGKPVDQRSDIFSLGIVLFEMLSGRIPFSDESPLGLMLEVVKAEIPDVQQINDAVDPATAAILARMVAKEPQERFQSCHDLVAALAAHPLLARGETVKLTRPAARDDATLVGIPAPRSAARAVTAPPVVRAGQTTAPSAAVATPGTGESARPSVLARPDARRGGGVLLPLGIAAAVLLMVAGGAFAFRAQVMDFVRGFGDGFTGSSQTAYEAGHNTGKASNPVGVSIAGVADAPGADATNSDSMPADATTASVTDAAFGTLSPGEIEAAIENDRQSSPVSPLALAAADTQAQPAAPFENAVEAAPMPVPAAPDNPATTTNPAVAAAPAAAPAKPPVRPVAAPPPRVAVIALGDAGISGPASSRIEQALADAGFDMVNGAALGLAGNESLSTVLSTARASAAVAVVVRAEPVGSEQLQYYGRTTELYVANLTVRAYKTSDRSTVGTSLDEKVQFTTLNADTQARNALSGKLDRLVSDLAPWRRRG